MTLVIAKIIWALGCVTYFIIRYPRMRSSRKMSVAQRFDRGREAALMGISYTGLFFIPLIYVSTDQPKFANYGFHPAQAWVGLAVLIAAMTLLYRTHHDLGRLWSMTLELRNEHKLVTCGVYNKIRHPMYSAFWLWALSQALLLPNWITGMAGITGFGVLFFARVGREERMMMEKFGDEYRTYMTRTHRIIPGIY